MFGVEWMGDLFWIFVGTVVSIGAQLLRQRWKHRRERKQLDFVDLSGTWHTAWHTSVNGESVSFSEKCEAEQKGKVVRIRNVEKNEYDEISYDWKAELTVKYGPILTGTYSSLRQGSRDGRKFFGFQGTIYLKLNARRGVMTGAWMGASVDSDFIMSVVAAARTRESAEAELRYLVERFDVPQYIRQRSPVAQLDPVLP